MQAQGETVQTAAGSAFFEDIRPWLQRVEDEIARALQVDDPLIEEVSTHLLRGGGKRLRPALVLLSGAVFTAPGPAHFTVATAAELIHMATLVHDDSIDRSALRRGVPTVNARWGDRVAILTGDYLFARAFSLLAGTGDDRAVGIMADVVFQMCMGEIAQFNQSFDPSSPEGAYLERVNKKTAHFIAECCRAGGLLAGAPEPMTRALRDFGYGVGMGFQIVDDILDLTARADRLGKPIGSDLRSGVITLPVLHALANSPQGRRIAEVVVGGRLGDAEVEEIRALVEEAGGLQYAYQVAERFTREARLALSPLPAGPAREALAALADALIHRDY